MITDEQFKYYICQISDSYERLKDTIHTSEISMTDLSEKIFTEIQVLRDLACIALRASHTTKNPQDN